MEFPGFFIEVNVNLNQNNYSTEWHNFILTHSCIFLEHNFGVLFINVCSL